MEHNDHQPAKKTDDWPSMGRTFLERPHRCNTLAKRKKGAVETAPEFGGDGLELLPVRLVEDFLGLRKAPGNF